MPTPKYEPISTQWTADLASVTLSMAIAKWYDKYGTVPRVLRCSSIDAALARDLLKSFVGFLGNMTVVIEPTYADDEWSVDDEVNIGFGSEGA